jgi:hypothetical protein
VELESYKNNLTVCRIYEFCPATCEKFLVATGTAELTPGDKFNPEIGESLALARALESLSKGNADYAAGLVKHADNMKAQRAHQLATIPRKGFHRLHDNIVTGYALVEAHDPDVKQAVEKAGSI